MSLHFFRPKFGLLQWLSSKESACNAGDAGDAGSIIPGWGRSPGGGRGNPFQYFCLENPMNRGVCRATVHGIAKSQTRLKQLSTHTSTTQVWRRAGASAPRPPPPPPSGADPCQPLSIASPILFSPSPGLPGPFSSGAKLKTTMRGSHTREKQELGLNTLRKAEALQNWGVAGGPAVDMLISLHTSKSSP